MTPSFPTLLSSEFCMLAIVLPAPFAAIMFAVDNFALYCVLSAIVYLLNSLWLGSAITAYQDFVLPRMRGTIGATYLLGATMLGLALGRSEEHTSELQSLMRISYAVFCLKKK